MNEMMQELFYDSETVTGPVSNMVVSMMDTIQTALLKTTFVVIMLVAFFCLAGSIVKDTGKKAVVIMAAVFVILICLGLSLI